MLLFERFLSVFLHVTGDYYHTVTSANNVSANGLASMITTLLGAITNTNTPGTLLKTQASATTSGFNLNLDVTSFFSPQNGSGGTTPKAYLHVLLFDERFKFDKVNSYVQQVSGTTGKNTFDKSGLNAVNVKKNGYAFIYVSNESENDVYFDNFMLTHERGRILEETHYYPFGLTMAGLSSKAITFGGAPNKFRITGKEEQRQEFGDGSGLDWLDFGARMYDAQIGRWNQVDPLAEQMRRVGLYSYSFNNPILFTDPEGMSPDLHDDVNSDQKNNFTSLAISRQLYDNSFADRIRSFENWFRKNDFLTWRLMFGNSSVDKEEKTKEKDEGEKIITIYIVDGKAAGKGDVGHTAIQIGDKIYGYYPTDVDGDGGWGMDDLLNSPGELRIESKQEFDTHYLDDGYTTFSLRVTDVQYNSIQNKISEYKTNPGDYSLGGNQCTSVVAKSLIQSGVILLSQHYYVSTGPVPGNWHTTPLTGTMLLSPSDFKRILSQEVNKSVVVSQTYYKAN